MSPSQCPDDSHATLGIVGDGVEQPFELVAQLRLGIEEERVDVLRQAQRWIEAVQIVG